MSKTTNSSCIVRQVFVGLAWSALGFALVPGVLAQALVNSSLVSPAGGGSGPAGVSQSFQVAFSDAAGYGDILSFNLVFGGTSPVGSCYLTYYPGINTLVFWNDAGTAYTFGTPGSAVTLQNSQCSVDLAHTSVTGSGTVLTFSTTLTFGASFAGAREIFALGVNAANQYSPWVDLGTWTVGPRPLVNPSLVSPAGGGSGPAGVSQSFQVAFSDAAGYGDLLSFNLVFGGTSPVGSCYLTYYPGINTLVFWNDAGTAYTFGTPGSAVTLQNSQCSVDLAHTSVTGSGTVLTFSTMLTFGASFAGAREIFALGVNAANQYSPWVDLGAWTVGPRPLANPSLVSPSGGGSGAAGVSQNFQVAFSDAAGYGDILSFNLVFGGTSPVGSCYLTYYPGINTLVFWNDAGTASTFGTPGTAVTLQNSQCSVDLAHTSVTGSGTVLTFSAMLTFSASFAGAREIFALGVNAANQYSPWVDLGAWTVWPVAPITFQSNPSGRSIQVDGSLHTTPFTLQLSAGSHTVDASVAQSAPAGTRYNFQSWSDNGAAAHTVTTTASSATFTANFTTQYQLTTTAGLGGSISQSDPSGWYTSGSQATVTANPNVNAGYQFVGFSGALTGPASPQYLTMNGASAVTASFAPAPPVVSVTPSSGAGASQILAAVYIDPIAYGQITEALLLVNASTTTASACYLRWTPGNHFYLRNDADSAWLDGTTASVQNSQCRLDAPANGAQGSGQTLTANFGLTFFGTFLGAKNVYLATTTALRAAVWQQAGAWTVDLTSGDYTVTAKTPTATTGQLGYAQYQYDVRAIGGLDGSTVRVRTDGVVIPSMPPCLSMWDQASGWDPAMRTGTVTLVIMTSAACGGGYTFTYTPQVTWQSGGGLSKTTTDTTLVCCGSPPISITTTPTSTTLRAGQSATFTATVKGTLNTSVTWDNPGIGTLSQNGIYTAPANISTTQYVVITAHSNQDSSKTASATVTLQPAAPTNVPQYTITGQVFQSDGSPFGPLAINVTGDQAQTVPADASGNYSVPPLPAGHYVVTPSSAYGAATPDTYDLLSSRNGRHVLKPFRFSPLNRAPDPDPDPAEARGLVHVTANGVAQKADFWWTDSHINAKDIDASEGCWIMPINGPADYSHRDTSIGVSWEATDSLYPYHFVVTFPAPPSAIGLRELVCRYGGKDIIGWDYISFEAAPLPAVSVQAVYFGGSGFVEYQKDCPNLLTTVANPLWLATNSSTNDCSANLQNEAAVYVSGTTISLQVRFSVTPPLAQATPNVRIEGVIPGLGKFAATGTIPAGATFTWDGSSGTSPAFTADTPLPSTTRYYNPMTVNWQVSWSGTPCPSSCVSAGTSSNTVYVVLARPTLLPGDALPMRTPIHLAVTNDGAASLPDAFRKTWAQFAGPADVKGWNGRLLYYYMRGVGFDNCASGSAAALLTSPTGSGQCSTFALLFLSALGANGIPVAATVPPTPLGTPPLGPLATLTTVGTNDLSYFLVKDWSFSGTGFYAGDGYYWWEMILNPLTRSPDGSSLLDLMVPPQPDNKYGDLTSLNTIRGQNTSPPSEKMFGSHYIVKVDNSLLSSGLGGPYFDPSYGVTYSDAAMLELTALDGYAIPDLANFPHDPTRWLALSIAYFGPQRKMILVP